MGNKMCKKKTENAADQNATAKSPSAFDRIFTRLHLKSNSWKSDSQLNRKHVLKSEAAPKNGSAPTAEPLTKTKSKSTEWIEADLEVPDKDDAIRLKNPQLSFIFNDNSTPTPPPRKHKKSIREKIESVAKNSIQAFQPKKAVPIEEPLCTKRTIDYSCPCHDADNCQHKSAKKDAKRKKSLSVVSLPNYNELKFSVAASDGSNLKYIDSSVTNSANSLPGGESKKTTPTPSGWENYMTRCRSFGSLLNNKLKAAKQPTDPESDDSFGGLEEWDAGILEHYNPKDTSLPRPRKSRNDKDIISDIEKLIVPDESVEIAPPVRPVRRSESLVKKVEAQTNSAPPDGDSVPLIAPQNRSDAEHFSLMRILQEYSVGEAKKQNGGADSCRTAVPPTLRNLTADFITGEKRSACPS